MTITDLSNGEEGTVLNVESNSDLSNRFRELGLLDGTKIRMVKKAPFKGPVEIQVGHSYLSIRWDDAKTIHVKS